MPGPIVPMVDIHVVALEEPRPRLIGASATHVWVHDGDAACAIALASGQEEQRVQLGDGGRPVARGGDVMVLWRENVSVTGFDLETGAVRWTLSLAGADGFACATGSLLVLRKNVLRPEISLYAPESGAFSGIVRIFGTEMTARSIFVAAGNLAALLTGSQLICVDLSAKKMRWRVSLDGSVLPEPFGQRVYIDGETVVVECPFEAAEGPSLRRTHFDAAGVVLRSETVPRSATPPTRWLRDMLGVTDIAIRNPPPSHGPSTFVEAESGFSILLEGRRLVVKDNGTGETTRVPAPIGDHPSVLATSDYVVWLCDQELHILAARRLGGAAAVDLRVRVVPAPERPPGRVSFVGPSGVAIVQHPDLGRITLTGTSGLSVGDEIVIARVTRKAGGVIKVGAWHRAGAEPEERERVYRADDQAEAPAEPVDSWGREVLDDDVSPAVTFVEGVFGLSLPALRKLAALCASSPLWVRRWHATHVTLLSGATHERLRAAHNFGLDDDEAPPILERLSFQPFGYGSNFVLGVVRSAGEMGVASYTAESAEDGDDAVEWRGSFEQWLAELFKRRKYDSAVQMLAAELALAPEPGPREPPWFRA